MLLVAFGNRQPVAGCIAETFDKGSVFLKRLRARTKQQLFPRMGQARYGAWILCLTTWGDGRSFRMLNAIEDYNRQLLWIKTVTSSRAART
ncbi:MAG: hypothetical protein R3281_05275 [Balneolaceae bacterium]|nr:hypothetical protein [Balneolaceae bacterium]